ncbi:ADP-ribosyltransferase [Polaribacter aquimarinus]|uniref:ADP ribosyltransferase domain-containing protein n=1 Tax=Polaribacter aquimarinus TaxID=2100726 RepID=A0A2U2J6T6_9FLAO|nr:ADP-ribosyltransferase [Polaribacter aquimarinus]PWG04044.1 hypothetical protein DIS07_14735 [Polaribacter aquimarinus]
MGEINETILSSECLKVKTYRDNTLLGYLEKNIQRINYKKFKLTEIEAKLINSYTGQNSSWINSELRSIGHNICNCKIQVQNLINSGLNKLPSFNKNTVYRFEPNYINGTLTSKKWFRKKIGKIIKAPFFLSTTKDKDWGNSEVVLKINTSVNSLGKDLSEIGINSSEKEVLFKTNSLFKIIDVNENFVELNEIENITNTSIFWNIMKE